jgi:hypothetical protein
MASITFPAWDRVERLAFYPERLRVDIFDHMTSLLASSPLGAFPA